MAIGRSFRLCVIIVLSWALTAPLLARTNPIKPPIQGTSASQSASVGESGFECGTYKGNHLESVAMYHEWRARQRQLAQSPSPTTTAAEYEYDDVWVIEDDAAVLFVGTNRFDTVTKTFLLEPDPSGGYAVSEILFTFDIGFTQHTNLGLGDDGNSIQPLGFTFPFYDTDWSDIHINSNGAIAFGADVNQSGFYDANDFFSDVPKIAPYMMDLDPTSGGAIYFGTTDSTATLTWAAVREFNATSTNSFQVVMKDDGSVTLTYTSISSTSQSNGAPVYVGIVPGPNADMELISLSDDLPYTTASGAGFYEGYISLGNPAVNDVGLMQRFYQTYEDVFFQTVYFTNFVQTMAGFANEVNIMNQVSGIGLDIFDDSDLYGSNGVLESRCNMNRLAAWVTDPEARFRGTNNFLTIMGQESGHRWGAFMWFMDGGGQLSNMMLGRSDAHWSYYADVDHSSLEGGNWENVTGTQWICPTLLDYFSEIDEYTFGLRTPEEVSDMFYISSASNNNAGARSAGTPPQNATAVGTAVPVTVYDFIAGEGMRTPLEPDQNKDLRQAFMFILKGGTNPPLQQELDKIAGFRRAWEPYFERACDGRLTCNTSLTVDYPVAVVDGRVSDELTTMYIDDLTVRSLERQFDQHVPGGGRYMFRYQADENSGSYEEARLVFEAPGYYPDSVWVNAVYGYDTDFDVVLRPIPSDIDPSTPLPTALYQNYPNPFNPTTTIKYDLQDRSRVRLAVFNARGQLVRKLVDAEESPGRKLVEWDGRDDYGRQVASGIYLYRIETNAYSRTRKMTLLK